jgi:twitching motility protein PilJ
VFALAALISRFISNSITNPITYLVGVMNKLASGDTSARANIQSFDEIGALGRQFDMMVDQRELTNAQIQKENDTMNNSIIDMLQAVGAIAQKDLTIKAPVAEDITGPLGDALNYLTDETAKVMNNVVRIAGEVSSVSKQVKGQSDTVLGIAADERREVEQSAIELNEASIAMLDIAKLALSCNEAAGKAIKNTDKAQETVLGTVQGITSIRDTIRETEKRIKRLGERSQEIGSVVTIINNIAERTHILALNASMHAASAGEAGKGFAVVANEVQKLAENAREATQQISGLVNNIQVETADTVTNMNDAITQVVKGTNLAQQAGNEMKETRDTTAELVQLVQRIADSSKIQAETSQRLQVRSVQIQKASEQTFEQLQEQGKQTERLVGFSGNLVESVGVFKLPKAVQAAV